MTEEDEEFNRIERESKQRMESVVSICRVTTPEDVRRIIKPWMGLTEDEVFAISNTMPYADRFDFAAAIEARLRENNT